MSNEILVKVSEISDEEKIDLIVTECHKSVETKWVNFCSSKIDLYNKKSYCCTVLGKLQGNPKKA